MCYVIVLLWKGKRGKCSFFFWNAHQHYKENCQMCVLDAHCCVGLDETVLQLPGLVPVARQAESLQVTNLLSQHIGQSTHTPNCTCNTYHKV